MNNILSQLAYLLPIALSVSWSVVSGTAALAQTIPIDQQRSPAALEDKYPYRPNCLQLIPQLSATNPAFTAWGPVIGGKHHIWYGLPTGMEIAKAITELDALGLCVQGGEMVPWQAMEGIDSSSVVEGERSPLEVNAERLKNAPDAGSKDTGAAAVIAIALLGAGGVWLWERFEDRPFMRRLVGNSSAFDSYQPTTVRLTKTPAPPALPIASELPDRVSQEELQASQRTATQHQRTALDVLLSSPFVSRAFYGFQRTGKTNLVASTMQQLAAKGVRIYSLNLNSVGNEDTVYWQGFRSVRGDLTSISDPEEAKQLIDRATALVEEFMADPNPSILTVDEWAPMTASHSEHIDLLMPLIKSLANKITGFSSSGMKRRKAIYTIASEMVASTMEEFGKAVKRLSVCLVGIAPGHEVQWDDMTITFSWELYSQVSRNYPGVLVPPPEDSDEERIVFINGDWLALGTRALVPSSVAIPTAPTETFSPTLPKAVTGDLGIFREWLDKKVGQTITLQMFKNARIFREKIPRSETSYLTLCDKSIMKGWLSQTGEQSFYVLE